jgi:hypothetical protein
MKHNIELIKEIRNAYAKEEGYESFASMASYANIVPRDVKEIAKRYAEAMNIELQAKCDKYEGALKGVQKYCKEAGLKQVAIDDPKGMAIYHSLHLANEALCGEGDRICPNCNKAFNADRHGYCRECGSDEYNNQKDGK